MVAGECPESTNVAFGMRLRSPASHSLECPCETVSPSPPGMHGRFPLFYHYILFTLSAPPPILPHPPPPCPRITNDVTVGINRFVLTQEALAWASVASHLLCVVPICRDCVVPRDFLGRKGVPAVVAGGRVGREGFLSAAPQLRQRPVPAGGRAAEDQRHGRRGGDASGRGGAPSAAGWDVSDAVLCWCGADLFFSTCVSNTRI